MTDKKNIAHKLPTVNIKGKEYVMVKDRLKYFRETHSTEFSLTTDIVKLDDNVCVLKAYIKDINGRVIAEGMASELKANSMINKTSYVENCETSAWGRALANFGIGIDDSVGSADEVATAINSQEKPVINPQSQSGLHGETTNDEYFNRALTAIKNGDLIELTSEKFNEKLMKTFGYLKKHNAEDLAVELDVKLKERILDLENQQAVG
jgi:hypothetical protein